MANTLLEYTGAIFPLELTQARSSEGEPLYTYNDKGEKVPLIGWYPINDTNKLIKHNLTSILIYQIGQRFRNEKFGTRLYECLEEPNTQLLEFLVKDFLKSSISTWEPRIKSLSVDTLRNGSKLYIEIHFKIENSTTLENIVLEYNSENYNLYVY